MVNLTATAPDPTDGRDQVVGRRPEAAHDGHVPAPQAHLGAARQGRARQVRRHSTASAPARSSSTSSRRGSSPASRPTRTTTGAARRSTRSCSGSSTTRTRWSPRSRAASSTRPRTCRAPPSISSRRTRTSSTVQGYQGAMTELGINGGDGLKKPHPALLDLSVRKAIGHAIDKQTIVEPRAGRARQAAARRSASRPTRPGRRRSRRPTASTSTSTRQSRSSRTPATRTPTATASARCRTAASRSTSATTSATDSETGPPIAEFVTGWLKEIGIATTREGLRRQRADGRYRQGRLRHVRVGVGAVRGPGPDAVVLQVRPDRERSRRTRPTTTTTRTTATRSTTSSTSSRRWSWTPRSASRSSTRCSRASAVGRVPHAVRVSGHAGVPEGPLRGLRPAAGRDRARVLLEHVAVIRADEAGVGRRPPGTTAAVVPGSSRSSCLPPSRWSARLVWARRRRTADERE